MSSLSNSNATAVYCRVWCSPGSSSTVTTTTSPSPWFTCASLLWSARKKHPPRLVAPFVPATHPVKEETWRPWGRSVCGGSSPQVLLRLRPSPRRRPILTASLPLPHPRALQGSARSPPRRPGAVCFTGASLLDHGANTRIAIEFFGVDRRSAHSWSR